MATSQAPRSNIQTKIAIQRIEAFRKRFGEGHFYLACHAALPAALTTDLLYRLWANFQRDTEGAVLDTHWIATADLLLSNLCEEVGYELYEMDHAVRNELLRQLKDNPRFGVTRIHELSEFLLAYVEQQLASPDPDIKDLAEAQKRRALSYQQPKQAAHDLAIALSQLQEDDQIEWIRMAALIETLEEPLAEFQSLLLYAQAMRNFAYGDLEAARLQFSEIADATNRVQVAEVKLSVPKRVQRNTSPTITLFEKLRGLVTNRFAAIMVSFTVISAFLIYRAQIVELPQIVNPSQTSVVLSSTSVFRVSGETCPAGSTLVTYEEAINNRDLLSQRLGTWDIARLANDGSMDGSGYSSKIRRKDERSLGHALCKRLE